MTANQTFLLALVVLIGGGLLIRFPPATIEPNLLVPFLTGSIGTVLGFVFSSRSSTETAQHIAAAQPTQVVNAQPADQVNVNPPGGAE